MRLDLQLEAVLHRLPIDRQPFLQNKKSTPYLHETEEYDEEFCNTDLKKPVSQAGFASK
jgi:hypothetical protein